MKTEYTMLLHTIERRYGQEKFNHDNAQLDRIELEGLCRGGVVDRLSTKEWRINNRGKKYLERVRQHFAG